MLNKITIMGRLTKDPEYRKTQSGVDVTTFTVAVDRDFGNKQTDFFNCTAWQKTAEFVSKYFRKGSMAVVSGSMQSRKWEDRNGNKRLDWDLQVENIYFGESKKAPDIQATDFEELDDDEEMPF